MVKNPPANAGDVGSISGPRRSLATHSSIPVWEIPWMEGPGRLQSRGRKELDMTEQLSTHVHRLHKWVYFVKISQSVHLQPVHFMSIILIKSLDDREKVKHTGF